MSVLFLLMQACNLKPVDADGYADPYPVVTLNKKSQGDSSMRCNRTLAPAWGCMFEFEITLPAVSNKLKIQVICRRSFGVQTKLQVIDYDRLSAHDLMSETTVDIEQRFYTRHQAAAGLPLRYDR